MRRVEPGKFCGCAIGMGITSILGEQMNDSSAAYKFAIKLWPWLDTILEGDIPEIAKGAHFDGCSWPVFDLGERYDDVISAIFFNVCEGKFTLDQLIDWVRSVEPAEPEPAIAEGQHASELVEKQP